MKETGYCEYCQVELPCGHVTESTSEKDLLEYTSTLMGDAYVLYLSILDGELTLINHDYNPFASVKINYCPMCGRKLEHWEDPET